MTATGTVSASALSALVKGPGIDTRVWVAHAYVTDIGFDAARGIFVDLKVRPDGRDETAYLGTGYAGNAFGDFSSLEPGDEVVVVFPNGDPNAGPVIVSRYWNSGDPPPSQAASQSDATTTTLDRVTVIKPGQKWKVYTTASGDGVEFTVGGDGSIVLETLGSGTIKLGGRLQLQPGVLGDTLNTFLSALVTALAGLTLPVSGSTAGPPATGTIPTLPNILSTKVEIAP